MSFFFFPAVQKGKPFPLPLTGDLQMGGYQFLPAMYREPRDAVRRLRRLAAQAHVNAA